MSESDTANNDQEEESTYKSSGWVSNFKYLLPPSWSKSSKSLDNDANENVDVSNFNPDDSDPIFLKASTFNNDSGDVSEQTVDEEICEIKDDDDGVIDVECYVVGEEKNLTSAATVVEEKINDPLLGDTVEEGDAKHKSSRFQWMRRLLSNRFKQKNDVQSAVINATSSEQQTSSFDSDTASDEDETDQPNTTPTQSSPDTNTTTPKRRNQPIFHNLETKEIDTTTQIKQRKWSRRRKRLSMLTSTLKSAAILFILTFLGGNVMNQFVDLSEDGSFEVHFGKSFSGKQQLSGLTNSDRSIDTTNREKKPSLGVKRNRNPITTEGQLSLVSRAVHKIGPAVVRVETETDILSSSTTETPEEDRRGDIYDGIPDALDDKLIDFGQGSGIIILIRDEYHILTNAHVVDGASRINVLLTDGRRLDAELVGCDDIVDVAVLKILLDEGEGESGGRGMDLPVAELGDSDRLEVGTFVTAIGSPGGLDNSCTIGIVSGLKRCPKAVGIPDKAGVLQYIQTDAAINVGNSGGPLVDVETGDIIGINTCIRANMEGTSFAIPINKVMGILDDLYEGRHITHGYLGVQMSTVNPTLARYYNKMQSKNGIELPEKDGVIVEKVFKKSPAETGGLKKYDFVSKIDGQQVTNADDAHLIIDQAPIGQDLSLTIIRGDNEVVVQVKPEDLSVRLKQLREERKRKKT